ncbi:MULTISPECIES: hypothetical protein [Bradyrhizobium]|jgi:hypothetical protein|uniref:hypothetical protein n=1 Tax=Bradyrhizobium TaxID=374 RepID=UPI0012BB9859|nr:MULTISPECIES: hypothetical protein [Bradyrhizobium]MCS3445919.1 hypothetical protein [Bradyrhizobium elkanii]MCS3562949.1 hypothetical protein [Bradyrhizobium elkanii]MCW2147215.1 hypothetical protein [Bradyrhizobium elkanii]MCW2353707.1 hypothetical protein [Bradyrhizobium elkanii]MCW2380046.1 hypothetical protein [Bradyrhizobium elkanii]
MFSPLHRDDLAGTAQAGKRGQQGTGVERLRFRCLSNPLHDLSYHIRLVAIAKQHRKGGIFDGFACEQDVGIERFHV